MIPPVWIICGTSAAERLGSGVGQDGAAEMSTVQDEGMRMGWKGGKEGENGEIFQGPAVETCSLLK